uniref:Interferon gamma n=2 Tax=Trachinotus TaxID=173330 RepID=A0A5C1DBQ7_TRAOV|nr:interferon gamma [Trachinotus ovatus]
MVAAARAVVCVTLWLTVCQARGFTLPAKMNKTISNLLQHYNISSKLRYSGKPVFSRELLTGKLETKKLILGGVLEAYEKLLDQMLKELPSPGTQTATAAPIPADKAGLEVGEDVRTQLTYILEKVQDLRKHHYQEQDNILQKLHALKHIQMDNLVVQNKALFELPRLYSEASSLLGEMKKQMRRRRRRQARRAKTSLRA